jgi:hypothetical protein
MWTTTHSIETNVGAEAIWRAWADVPRWPEWNGDIEISADFDETLRGLVDHASR